MLCYDLDELEPAIDEREAAAYLLSEGMEGPAFPTVFTWEEESAAGSRVDVPARKGRRG